MVFLFAAAILTTFALSMILGARALSLVTPHEASRSPELALHGSLVAVGCIAVGLPQLRLAFGTVVVGALFGLPFLACAAALWRVPAALRAPRRTVPWSRFRVACAAVGTLTAAAILVRGFGMIQSPWAAPTPVFDAAFALGCACLGLGIGAIPGAIRTADGATAALRFTLLAAFYALAPLVAIFAAHRDLGASFGLSQNLRAPAVVLSPLIRGPLVSAAGGLTLAVALWVRRMDRLDREDEDENEDEEANGTNAP